MINHIPIIKGETQIGKEVAGRGSGGPHFYLSTTKTEGEKNGIFY